MKKKVLVMGLVFMLALSFFCTKEVSANAVSWNDFVSEINRSMGGSYDFESVLASSSVESDFKSQFNSCYAFYTLGNFGADNAVNTIEPTNLYFCFYNSSMSSYTPKIVATSTQYQFGTNNSTRVYTLSYANNTITRVGSSDNGQSLFTYSLNRFPDFSSANWRDELTATYFIDKAYFKPLAWNVVFVVRKDSNSGAIICSIDSTQLNSSDYPWENDSTGGQLGNYYNYDFEEDFITPYVAISNVNGKITGSPSDATIPFFIYHQSGDEYYPFSMLKMDLVVSTVTKESGDNPYWSKARQVASYKTWSGDYANTNGYSHQTIDGKIIRTEYNLKSKFESAFVDEFINDDVNGEDYVFQIYLYNFWGDLISYTPYFFFWNGNALNEQYIPPNYYDDNFMSAVGQYQANVAMMQSIDLNGVDTNFNSLINTFKSFLSSVMGFFDVLPGWMIAYISFAFMVAITLRVLGR